MQVDTANIYLVTTGKLHPVVVELVTDEASPASVKRRSPTASAARLRRE
jgi:hypothetical protein